MALKNILLPDLGEGVTEGEIIKIKVSEGDKIVMDQPLLEVMTDKASMEVPSSIEGIVKKTNAKEGDIVSVGAVVFAVETEGDSQKEEKAKAPPAKKAAVPAQEKSLSPKKGPSEALAIPATRKLAEELGISLKKLKGSGPKGEIKRSDLLDYIKSALKAPQNPPAAASAALPESFEEEKREPVTGVKRLMFESMALSKATIPHFTVGDRARADRLLKIKTEMKAELAKRGLKAGWLAFFIKALIPALKEFPIFNSFYDPQSKEIVFRKGANIGFAVDSPRGLLVPVLKQAQNKSLLEIIKEIQELAEAARQGSIKREGLKGAGISLTNMGSLGGLFGTPIINPPEMAIMGIFRLFRQTIKTPAGEFEERPFINFSITCDHRFIDGATAIRFLKSFIRRVEEPSLLLLE